MRRWRAKKKKKYINHQCHFQARIGGSTRSSGLFRRVNIQNIVRAGAAGTLFAVSVTEGRLRKIISSCQRVNALSER